MVNALVMAFVVALGVFSARCAQVAAGSPYTMWGWILTVAYCSYVVLELARLPVPAHLEYVFLAALTGTFIIAGIKDEAQAEPWWWPVHRGPTRAGRRPRR
ncbi:MAG: hypothetical protein NVS2B17_07450 [Candidatus Velthaea sp.]